MGKKKEKKAKLVDPGPYRAQGLPATVYRYGPSYSPRRPVLTNKQQKKFDEQNLAHRIEVVKRAEKIVDHILVDYPLEGYVITTTNTTTEESYDESHSKAAQKVDLTLQIAGWLDRRH